VAYRPSGLAWRFGEIPAHSSILSPTCTPGLVVVIKRPDPARHICTSKAWFTCNRYLMVTFLACAPQ
jgi:hypothetical protein